MKRKDFVMHDRLAEELCKLGDSNIDIARKVGCSKKIVSAWFCGYNIPSAYHLKGLYLAGVDIIYVLTGKRE